MTRPHRVQLQRTKDWRMPPNTISVARPGRYGNPIKVGAQCSVSVMGLDGLGYDVAAVICAHLAVSIFKSEWEAIWSALVEGHPEPADKHWAEGKWAMLRHLRGSNLACWCAPSEPCHADVWLDIANRPSPEAR